MTAYRTVRWLPPASGFFVVPPLQWPDKRPVDYEDFALDLALWLADDADTIASVTCGTLQTGMQVGAASFVGSVVSTKLLGGIVGTLYTLFFTVTGAGGNVIQVAVSVRCVVGLTSFPTSPVMVAPGGFWYSMLRSSFETVPVWASLPTTETANADAFFLDGGEIHIPSNTTLLPASPVGLAVGDLWNNGGTVMCNGNPGLPLSSSTHGTLLYNGGALTLA